MVCWVKRVVRVVVVKDFMVVDCEGVGGGCFGVVKVS